MGFVELAWSRANLAMHIFDFSIHFESHSSAVMEISRLLSSSPGCQEDESEEKPESRSEPIGSTGRLEVSSLPQNSSERQLALVPDNQRKRKHHLSATQKQQRHEQQIYESRVYNLTLDINDLRQQIRQLMELRDLNITQLLLTGQRFQADVLKLTWTLLEGLQSCRVGLVPRAASQQARGGEFVMQQGHPPFGHRTFEPKSIRILALVDNESTGESAREIRRVCGNAGGCVVEIVAGIAGTVTQDTFAILFPNVLNNQALVSRAMGQRLSFETRLLLYFNTQRRLVQVISQADVVGAFHALLRQ